jgi:hypothetical protein
VCKQHAQATIYASKTKNEKKLDKILQMEALLLLLFTKYIITAMNLRRIR